VGEILNFPMKIYNVEVGASFEERRVEEFAQTWTQVNMIY
jgi:hypothetical protein